MKKSVTTPEELRRDELVSIMREKKTTFENLIRKIKCKKDAITMLPENTFEYKNFALEISECKWELVSAFREYEAKREELQGHCQTYHLTGNTFISGYELLELLAERG